MCNPISTHRPDALLAKGVHCGLEWEVTKNGFGYRCGYVKVPPGHPWHGVNYDELDADVHGGLTFSEPDAHCDKGGPDSGWWLGFDCAHFGDARDFDLFDDPREANIIQEIEKQHPLPTGMMGTPTIKTTEYVMEQCKHLAEQVATAGRREEESGAEDQED